MRKILKITGLILAAVLIIIQFIQPGKNIGNASSEHDMLISLGSPVQVAGLLKHSCYDCHSNYTRYPWYSRISPISWYLNRHIEEGKKAVNFSNFSQLEKGKMIRNLSEICEVVESGNMPLQSFLIIHRDASLTEEEVKLICSWSESEAMKIMKTGGGS